MLFQRHNLPYCSAAKLWNNIEHMFILIKPLNELRTDASIFVIIWTHLFRFFTEFFHRLGRQMCHQPTPGTHTAEQFQNEYYSHLSPAARAGNWSSFFLFFIFYEQRSEGTSCHLG